MCCYFLISWSWQNQSDNLYVLFYFFLLYKFLQNKVGFLNWVKLGESFHFRNYTIHENFLILRWNLIFVLVIFFEYFFLLVFEHWHNSQETFALLLNLSTLIQVSYTTSHFTHFLCTSCCASPKWSASYGKFSFGIWQGHSFGFYGHFL